MRRNQGRPIGKAGLILGVGFDGDDGHTRITTGENFFIQGGSEQTHETMQEKVIRFNEGLKRRGKELSDLGPDEIQDIAYEAGMGE